MKYVTVNVTWFLLVVLLPSLSSAQSARQIMEKYDSVYRKSYSTFYQRMELHTCKYTIQQGRMHCSEKPRFVAVEGSRKFYGIDFKSTALVLEPIRDKGIGLLYNEYYSNKDNDNWIYLPSMGKVKRIISSSDGGTNSFMGTEFTTEDMQTFKINSYTYKILGEETYDNRPAWILELIPTPEKVNKTAYSKIIMWLDKERYIRFREDLYDHRGVLCKRYTLSDYDEVDNVWLARKLMMNNLINHRVSTIYTKLAAYNIEIPDDFYSNRVLVDFVFREKNMERLRAYMK